MTRRTVPLSRTETNVRDTENKHSCGLSRCPACPAGFQTRVRVRAMGIHFSLLEVCGTCGTAGHASTGAGLCVPHSRARAGQWDTSSLKRERNIERGPCSLNSAGCLAPDRPRCSAPAVHSGARQHRCHWRQVVHGQRLESASTKERMSKVTEARRQAMQRRSENASRLEVLHRTGLCESALRALQRAGDLVPCWMGRFGREDLEAFIESSQGAGSVAVSSIAPPATYETPSVHPRVFRAAVSAGVAVGAGSAAGDDAVPASPGGYVSKGGTA